MLRGLRVREEDQHIELTRVGVHGLPDECVTGPVPLGPLQLVDDGGVDEVDRNEQSALAKEGPVLQVPALVRDGEGVVPPLVQA